MIFSLKFESASFDHWNTKLTLQIGVGNKPEILILVYKLIDNIK